MFSMISSVNNVNLYQIIEPSHDVDASSATLNNDLVKI